MPEYVLLKRHLHSTEVLESSHFCQLVNYRYRHLCPNANALNAVYTFSAADTMANQVDLILTTNDPTGLCDPATDTLRDDRSRIHYQRRT